MEIHLNHLDDKMFILLLHQQACPGIGGAGREESRQNIGSPEHRRFLRASPSKDNTLVMLVGEYRMIDDLQDDHFVKSPKSLC